MEQQTRTPEREVAERVTRALHREAGLHVVVEAQDGVLTLSGLVDSEADVRAAEEIAARLAPGYRIDSNLEVQVELPQSVDAWREGEPSGEGDLPDDVAEVRAWGGDVNPDFTDQPLLSDPVDAAGPSSDADDPVKEGDEVYFPPTDPVVRVDRHGRVRVLGGFAPTSDDDVGVARSAEDGLPGDEALATAIRRELREDAATTDLEIHVQVRDGIARLRGTVASLEDAEDAEAVAARVPGVREVLEELTVAGL
jgi:osmotically-inducible protein OsmY